MLVGFTGYKGSGKDSAAAFAPYVKNYKFADPLKAMLGTYLKFHGYQTDDIWEVLEGSLKTSQYVEPFMGKTPRQVMQTLGTEWGRELVHNDIWLYTMEQRLASTKPAEIITVTDVRFINEAQLIYRMGGKLIRITREGTGEGDLHPSEAEMKFIVPTITIANDGTIKELQDKVTKYLGV
jgi:hypothetical protein